MARKKIELQQLPTIIVKNNDVEFRVSEDNTLVGRLGVNRAGVEWRRGKTSAGKGKFVPWNKLIALLSDN